MDYYRIENYSSSDALHLVKCRVVKKTAKGVWVKYRGKKKFVLSDPKGKRLAYAKIGDAIEAFKYRKKSQIEILTKQLAGAKEALAKIENGEQIIDNDLTNGLGKDIFDLSEFDNLLKE